MRVAWYVCGVAVILAGVGLAVSAAEHPSAPRRVWRSVGSGVSTLDTIACASPRWCVGLTAYGNQNQATTWNGHRWSAPIALPSGEDYVALSCPAVGTCLGLAANGLTLRLTDKKWRLGARYAAVAGPAYGSPSASLSCSAVDTCVAVDAAGDAATLGPNGWSAPRAIDNAPLTGISCPAPGSCVAVDGEGRVLVAHAGRFGRPRRVALDALQSVACASARFCAVADLDGVVRTGTPRRLGSASRLPGPRAGPVALACPSVGVCVAAGPDGAITALSNSHWRAVDASGARGSTRPLTETISCAPTSPGFCAVADGFGDVMVGRAPFSS